MTRSFSRRTNSLQSPDDWRVCRDYVKHKRRRIQTILDEQRNVLAPFHNTDRVGRSGIWLTISCLASMKIKS